MTDVGWQYQRRGADGNGHLFLNGEEVGQGYSGHPPSGLNNPDMEQVRDVGPIPGGRWLIGTFRSDPHLGPCVAPLTPLIPTDAFGRSGFFIHGDNANGNHSASDGCVILSLDLRERIRTGPVDSILVVI